MITIFCATYNRLDTLERTINSFARFTTPHEIVLIDNGTDHPDCIALLERLEQRPEVAEVFRLPKVHSMQALTDHYNYALNDWYSWRPKREWVAITDADICFEGTSRHALDAYLHLARRLGVAAGPHTRVDAGIPHGYPLRSRVLACESRLLYSHEQNRLDGIPYSSWQIDTTFHLFPRIREFRRLKLQTVRVGPPFDAMHLDWYIDVFRPTAGDRIYIDDPSPMSSWGRGWFRGFWLAFQDDQERAVAELLAEKRNAHNDLCVVSFMLAWAIQLGLPGTEGLGGLRGSMRFLDAAIPKRFSDYWARRADWRRMIYRGDFSVLGWPDYDWLAA